MEITFFIGSGISKKSGVPSVNKISEFLFDKTYLKVGTKEFEVWPEEEAGELEDFESAAPIQDYLKILKQQHDNYLKDRLGDEFLTTYEDLFSILDQVDDELMEVMDNYVLQDFIERQTKESKDFRDRLNTSPHELTLKRFCMICKFFIEAVLRESIHVEKIDGVSALESLLQNDKVTRLDFFSLNHDNLIESICEKNETTIIDGFIKPDGEVRLGNAYLYDNESRVYLYKLHGGTNWYWVINRETGQQGYAVLTGENKSEPKTESGSRLTTMALDKNFLTGVNKLIAYNDGFFGELQYRFTTHLKKINRLVMSGYGWNDRPLNRKLMDWLQINPDAKLLLIHKDGKDIFKASRYMNYFKLKSEIEAGKVIFIKKWFETVTAEEIIEFVKS